MQKTNSRKLAASVALAAASVALLLGLTFAWFTDSVKNEGNRIQAGTLGIAATVPRASRSPRPPSRSCSGSRSRGSPTA